jgi:hypothetical protein
MLGAAMTLVATSPATQPTKRTRAEVEALIQQAGKTPPPWWDSVPLNIPPGLELTWTQSNQWNPRRDLAAYLWDVIHPNPGRWREGLKLVHQSLVANKDNPQKLK